MYFASAFAIQICTAHGCTILCISGARGLGTPYCAGAVRVLPGLGGPRDWTLPVPWLSCTQRQSEQGCLPCRAAAEHREGVVALSDTI